MLLKIKLPETPKTLFSMPKDLSEENSTNPLYKKTLNNGPSKLSPELTTNPLLLFNTKEKPKNSTPKKFPPWF